MAAAVASSFLVGETRCVEVVRVVPAVASVLAARGAALYPAQSTAVQMVCASVVCSSNSTVMEPESRLTVTFDTPLQALTARSTCAWQEAQVMPPTSNFSCVICPPHRSLERALVFCLNRWYTPTPWGCQASYGNSSRRLLCRLPKTWGSGVDNAPKEGL